MNDNATFFFLDNHNLKFTLLRHHFQNILLGSDQSSSFLSFNSKRLEYSAMDSVLGIILLVLGFIPMFSGIIQPSSLSRTRTSLSRATLLTYKTVFWADTLRYLHYASLHKVAPWWHCHHRHSMVVQPRYAPLISQEDKSLYDSVTTTKKHQVPVRYEKVYLLLLKSFQCSSQNIPRFIIVCSS